MVNNYTITNMDKPATNITLHYWLPGQTETKTDTITTVGSIEVHAKKLLRLYETTPLLPGIELLRETGETMSIALDSREWALIHTNTNANFSQYCTRDPQKTDEASVDVRWEEVTPIPIAWFITKTRALAALEHWLATGLRMPELLWSADCS